MLIGIKLNAALAYKPLFTEPVTEGKAEGVPYISFTSNRRVKLQWGVFFSKNQCNAITKKKKKIMLGTVHIKV